MARWIEHPTLLEAAGTPPKQIQEFVGALNTATAAVSIARMISPPGWAEPGQTPEFTEYTVVLHGALHVTLHDQDFTVQTGQAIIVEAGEWVRYDTPEGAEYLAVCTPAFSPQTVHRDPSEAANQP